MDKEQNAKSVRKENSKKNQDNGTAGFLQLLQNNGMFVDCVSPIKKEMEGIEKQLK